MFKNFVHPLSTADFATGIFISIGIGTGCVPTGYDTMIEIFVGDVVLVRLSDSMKHLCCSNAQGRRQLSACGRSFWLVFRTISASGRMS